MEPPLFVLKIKSWSTVDSDPIEEAVTDPTCTCWGMLSHKVQPQHPPAENEIEDYCPERKGRPARCLR